MELTFETIRLTASDLADVSARHVSAQEIYSPTAPRKPSAQFGWRDRWWLNGEAAQQVALHYWFFRSKTEARTAAYEGRTRLSAQTVRKIGGHDSVYQPPETESHGLGETVWQAGANFLFVQQTLVVLVAEVGGRVSEETTLRIAQKIVQKIQDPA